MSELGEMLRDARHRRRLTLDEAAAATHIRASYLSAIEDGEYSTLPGAVYVTGFLRNYARFLGLPAEDVVQEYYALQPAGSPIVRPSTRVLANGYQRQNRTRLFWVLGVIVLFIVGAYIIKQYSNASAHAYTPPNVTASLGGTAGATNQPFAQLRSARAIQVQLKAVAPVWVRVTVDGRRVFQGFLRPGSPRHWVGHHSLYVMTFDGAHIRARYDGRPGVLLSDKQGIMVQLATPRSWQRVS